DSAEIAGDRTKRDPEDEPDEHADESDRERDAGAEDDAGQQVAPQPVGAEDEHRRRVRAGGEQMPVALEEPEHLVRRAPAEKADRVDLRPVLDVLVAERLHRQFPCPPVYERAAELALVEEVDVARRGVAVALESLAHAVRAEELRERRQRVHHQQDDDGDPGDPVLAEPPPHQPPLAGLVELLRVGVLLLPALAPVPFATELEPPGDLRHDRPPPNRILGSSQASNRSAINVPSTVRKLRTKMMLAAR